MFTFQWVLSFFKRIFIETGKTSWILFKIMIPISIIVKIIQEFGLLPYIGEALAPIMNLVGLPGETGLIWASALIVNIYGGLLAYFSLSGSIVLTSAQLTVLLTMILVAHTFPIELQIARKAGIKIIVMFLIRFVFSIILGFILFQTYQKLDILQEPAQTSLFLSPQNTTLIDWLIHELLNYATIFLFVFGLIFILEVLKVTGIITIINKMLYPLLKILGIGKEVLPITVIGLTLGISYGGAIIIKEANEGKASKRDVFYALVLMGLCHSMIEDTMMMFAIGGDISGILFARIIFALIISYIIVKITKHWSDSKFQRWFLTQPG